MRELRSDPRAGSDAPLLRAGNDKSETVQRMGDVAGAPGHGDCARRYVRNVLEQLGEMNTPPPLRRDGLDLGSKFALPVANWRRSSKERTNDIQARTGFFDFSGADGSGADAGRRRWLGGSGGEVRSQMEGHG